jgi:RNA-directed DNA polymerase
LKRVGYLFEKIIDIGNINNAIKNAARGKRKRRYVKKILTYQDYYAERIRQMLINKTYKPSPYKVKTIFDGANKKERNIYKPKFYPDQIVHWALMQQLELVIMKGMYKYSCGSVPGRGTSYGQKVLRKWLDNDYKNTKYCLKMDISKFYPSVNNEILKEMFRRKIKDCDCLWLIDTIIDSNQGLPIGNYTSQWFANFFLQGLDHYIKEQLEVKYYIRYVDDLVLLGSNKRKLHNVRNQIKNYLSKLNLKLKDNWQVFRVSKRGIDFLGFRFFYGKTILRKRNALRIRRRIKKISKKKSLNYKDACAVISYWGWIKRSDSYNFYNKYIRPYISLKKAKRTVSNYAKANNIC